MFLATFCVHNGKELPDLVFLLALILSKLMLESINFYKT